MTRFGSLSEPPNTMSSIPPKTESPPAEGRRRPVSVLALKLWETAESLEHGLDNPTEILEMLVSALAKGEQPEEVWGRLHEAAQRHDRLADLAFSYEHVVADKRIKLLPPEAQAFVYLQAARFCAHLFGDADGAIRYAERALNAVPGHPEGFALIEGLLSAAGKTTRLAELYVDASSREEDNGKKLALLRRAAELLQDQPAGDELAIDVGQRILRITPGDEAAREALVRRLLARGRHKDVADVFEQALRCDPPPAENDAVMIRELLVDLCLNELKDAQRALTHIEGLLALVPSHPAALKAAEALLENRGLALRAAAALSDAYEKSGRIESAIGMLSFELKQVRGPRRVEVQRRLGILRQDALNDPAGALELLGPVVAGDPGDDALRSRFVALSLSLNQPEQAARLLSRALQTSRDVAVRARVGVDVGHVYLKIGDLKRAQQAFQQALDSGQDEPAMLEAARQLTELYSDGDLKQLLHVLEVVVRLEPEKELRQAAARRLARLSDNESVDAERAIVAYKALIGSPWSDEALRRLEALYRDAGDEEGLAEVLFHRAERAKDPVESRKLAFRAAELASARTRNPDAAIAAWQRLIDRYGANREIHARMLPLLEQAQRYPELAALLEQELAIADPSERIPLLVRLAQVRQTRIGDSLGALAAFGEVLASDPTEPTSRAAVEKLLGVPEVRERAAEILEPIYRREEPGPGLLRVLEARADVTSDPAQRLYLLGEASELAAQALRDPVRALELAGRALAEAVATLPEHIHGWLERVQQLSAAAGDPVRRVRLLSAALGDRAVDSPALLELARATGDALAAAGEITAAMDAFRRALAFDPTSRELMQRVDQVLAQQGAPEERLSLYRAALEQEADTVRRRELLHAIATLQRRELADLAGAIETWRVAVAADARDLGAHEALIDALEEAGDLGALAAELERALEFVEGERRNLTLLRLAEVRTKMGEAARALAYYCEILKSADLADDVLEVVEQLAREQNDGQTIRVVIERRLQHTSDPMIRASLLERLGNAQAWQLDDSVGAAQSWLEGAHLSEGAAQDPERARRLYERVLGAIPDHVEAAERVVALGVAAGDWDGVQEAFEVLLRGLDERDIVAVLLGLEERAVGAAGAKGYVRLVDMALARGIQPFRARHVLLAKARALANAGGAEDEAAAIFRQLLEGAGDEAVPDADAFEAFLNRVELTPERVADYRWLFQWRLDRASDPAQVLFAWAQAEEHTFGDARAAAQQYERVVSLDPERLDAISELARLRAAEGDAAGALASLRALRDRCEPETRPAVDMKMATLLVGLGQPGDALELVTPILEKNPSDTEALRVVYHALTAPESRARAAAVLERVAEASEDPAARADVIEALLAASAEAPELAEAHSRWLKQLLETKTDEPEEALRLSLRGAEAAPGEDELWNVAEQMARKLDQPGPVAEAYSRAIERKLAPEVADSLGRRMVEFYEEWFDDAERVVQLLQRVLDLCPSATWAFERLKLAFNAAGRWSELFALYDKRLDAVGAAEQQELLREAAMAARDFAGDPERAIGYFERLNRLHPGDMRIESSLERLYERHARKRPLIELLSTRLGALPEAERGELMGRIAALWLDLGEPAPAFELAERLLERPDEVPGAVSLLERIVAMPESAVREEEGAKTVREQAAAHLKSHYRKTKSTVDVVRMLHVEADSAAPKQRVKLLEEVVSLSLEELGDEQGAFETLAALILLEPDAPRHKKAFAALAERLNAHDRRAEVLVSIAQHVSEAAVRAAILCEAADVYRAELTAPAHAVELYRQVLALGREDKAVALHAARELSGLLRGTENVAEHVGVLEQLAELESAQKAKRAALGEAAALALSALGDPDRAIAAWRARLAIGKRDFVAVDGLCRALERAQRWPELIEALEAHAELCDDDDGARQDRVRIAEIYSEILGDTARAIRAWEIVRERHGRSLDSFEALHRLLSASAAYAELALLLEQEVSAESDPTRRQSLHLELGELHRQHTGDMLKAIEAFVSAGSWDRAIEVAGTNHGDPVRGRQNCECLLALAVEVWGRGDSDADAAARAADWAISELAARLSEAGQYEAVVSQLLRGAQLPFPPARRRELRRDAACLCSDRLSDDARAVELFKGLLDEDPGDEVARGSVTRLALLLEEQGRHEEVVELWERQAQARSEGGDTAGAAVLWARAGDLAEQRLKDLSRAIVSYTAGAKLRGEACLEALARIYTAQGDHSRAANVLAMLCEQSSPEELAPRALELADAYTAIDDLGRARSALEHAVGIAVEPSKLRARLAALYRQIRDYAALAKLLSEEALRASDKKTQLGLLREAASLHSEERNDPSSAVPLLERAIELDPDDQKLRLQLAQALFLANRYEDATTALRDQIQRYGSRKPKDRALAHFQLARVLLASGREAEALGELDAASKIDPASPAIMQLLARVAFEQGELDRAERMYRALLLIVGREDDPDAPSKADALVALSEIASRRGDTTRASEFVESAFESALESPREAAALESALRLRGRYDLLSRALESRLSQRLSPAQAARALADLVALHAESLGDIDAVRDDLHARATRLESELEAADEADDAAWAALGRVYENLGDAAREATILERRVAAAASRSTRSPADADLFYRLARAKLQDSAAAEQGLDFLERALDISGDFSRAQALLSEVRLEGALGPRVSALYERVARAMGDSRALVSALSIRVGLPGVGIEIVREAVEAAKNLGDAALVARMIETALQNPDAELEPPDAAGLRLELAAYYEQAGDTTAALELKEQAAPHLPPEEARALLLSIAQSSAAVPERVDRAIRVYERLRREEPANRELWQPLLALYRERGSSDELLALLEETIPLLDDPAERSALRLEQVRVELTRPQREDAAIELLRRVLDDDPGQREAARLLRELLVAQGRSSELVELLRTELDRAKDAGDPASITAISRDLAELLEAQGRPSEALDVCRAALEWSAADLGLLQAVARLAEAAGDAMALADALEALLQVEQGERAAQIARRLSALREELGDQAGAERALEHAFRATPGDAALRDLLVVRYAEREEHGKIAELLEIAVREQPADRALLERLVEAQRAAGQPEAALGVVEGLIAQSPDEPGLYRTRAALLFELGREGDAIADLERAYAADPSLGADLVEALERSIVRAEPGEEGLLTLRLVEVLEAMGDLEGARARLSEFMRNAPEDLLALRKLASLDARTGNVEAAVTTLAQLVEMETGENLVSAVLSLAEACELAGRPGDARFALERALSEDRKNPEIRRRLRAVYEAASANRELAELLLEDAIAERDGARVALLIKAGELLLEPGGDADQAVRVLETAHQENPDSIELSASLARAYSAAQRNDDALALLTSITEANRGKRSKALGLVYREIARIHLADGFLTDALQALTKAFELDMKNGELAMKLGELAVEIDEDEIAQRAFRAVTIMKPVVPGSTDGATSEMKADANYHLAALARKLGDPRKAKVLASKALAEKSDHERARQLLAEIEKG